MSISPDQAAGDRTSFCTGAVSLAALATFPIAFYKLGTARNYYTQFFSKKLPPPHAYVTAML